MVYEVSSGTIPEGDAQQKAIDMIKKLLEYWRKKWPATEPTLLRNRTGPITRITWTSKFKSLGDAEQFEKMFWEDSGVQAIMVEWNAVVKEVGAPLITGIVANYMTDV
jgi:hypothetical protein